MKIVNLETTTDTQSWYKIEPLNGYSHIRQKQKLLRRQRGLYESLSSRRKCRKRKKSRKSSILTIHWNSANPVNNYHGIIVHQRSIDQRRMVLLRERYAVLLQSGLDEKWWADSMECYFHLRNVQDVLADGKTPGKKVLLGIFVGYALYAGEFGSVIFWSQTLRSWKIQTRQKSKVQWKGNYNAEMW